MKAGAFDSLYSNRNSLLKSIPNIILKSKNIFENKLVNQIDLFKEESNQENNFIETHKDWDIDIKLSKEFETLGFYISDHPLNQFKSIFSQYNIISYEDFNNDKDLINSNVACTVLKIQEKKTQKGNSYAIVKFSDLNSVFELFIFSDIFDANRNQLIEGNSLIITLIKNFSEENKNQKKINVKKIISVKDVVNKPIKEIKIKINNINEIDKLKNLSTENGKTKVIIQVSQEGKIYDFELNKLRNIDHGIINSLQIGKNIEFN